MERELENAFVAAVRLNRHRLYRVALSILRSPADAEDAVSTATEQTWKALPRIQDEDRLPVYLMRCTVNAARAELRKRRKTEPLEDYQDTLAAPEAGTSVREYVSGLKEKYRTPLILKYQENMREKEIASILHIPRGTVSSRIITLLKRIKAELLKEELDND